MIEIQLVTNAVLALARLGLNGAADNTGSGARVYDTDVPASAVFPYHVLFQIPGGSWSGPPLWDPTADAALVFQIDSIGNRRDQAQWAGDRAARVFLERTGGVLTHTLTPPAGWSECARLPADTPPGVQRDTSVTTPLYFVQQRFMVVLTPS